ncbi:glycosyltransferase [Sphingomonas sp. 22176]|uniref:glycosyltransferase n=1 Tax=Sphingomonas sp. 22176 TaxID=3453884 RepID=UPI003F8383FD
MTAFRHDGIPTAQDIEHLYRLACGRSPTEAELAAAVAESMATSIPRAFRSAEFKALRSRVVRRLPIDERAYVSPPDDALIRWTADFFPLAQETREAIRAASSWPRLLELLFRDWRFRKRIAREWRGISLRAFLAGLRSIQQPSRSIVGALDAWSDASVTGWATDRNFPDRVLIVELRLGGRFVAAGRTGSHTHPVGDRWSYAGATGFEISFPAGSLAGTDRLAEVREASTGAVLGRFETRDFRAPPLDSIGQIRAELAALREMIHRIESKLPEFNAALGFALDNYDEYHRTYYGASHQRMVAGAADAAMQVLVDATRGTPHALERTLAALAQQTACPEEITVLFAEDDLRHEMQLAVDAFVDRFGGRSRVSGHAIADNALAALMNERIGGTQNAVSLLVPAGCTLAPDAVAVFADAMRAGADIAYSDSDELVGDPVSLAARHVAPTFRQAFDSTLALQQDLCGPVLALRTTLVAKLSFRPGLGSACSYDFVLRAAAGGAGMTHIPRVLYNFCQVAGPDQQERLAVVREHLAGTDVSATVEPLRDFMEAPTDAVRIQWAVPAQTSVVIVVPTRDRLDLLMPCLGSIEASRPENRVDLKLIVIDNQSELPETRSFLRRVAESPYATVCRFDGAFNWAAMNNFAVRDVSADVFVFLNNDTIVLSPDCWDKLTAQALRKEVGAAGARLFFEDGTVQHAGVVMDEWHSFATHEGVGDAANAPGYLDRHLLTREVSMVTGACLATRSAVFREMGGFDATAFPVEGNDTDYCLRVRSRGFKVMYEGQACLYHFESKSRGYNDDEAKQRRAFLATQTLQLRWGHYARDPYYNPHFDRLAPPFQRLQAPRPLNFTQVTKESRNES